MSGPRPSRRDAIVALAGLPALLALEACGRKDVARTFEGEVVGGNASLGHKLRTRELLARPSVRTERVGTAILGAGVSGLSAAWTLARAGDGDFRVYELEDVEGGTARSGRNAVSPYPWGAHYVPVPVSPNPALEAILEEAGALEGRDAGGRPIWSEAVLCREPEERLFFRGEWFEGLFPRAGATPADLAELRRFEAETRRLAALRDAGGRRAFALPRRLSSPDAAFTALDRISLSDWLARNGFRSQRVRWFVEYACRDDFGSDLGETSAWAGLHYFAARLSGESSEDEAAPFLTWPEGNGRLVRELAKASASRLVTGALVFDVVPSAHGVAFRYLDAARDEVVGVEARDAVFALPKLVAPHLVAPWRANPPQHLSAFEYVPWLVANLTLLDRPRSAGFPMAWDNVLYDSKSLGYVVATHQSLRDHGPTVITYYRPFAGEDPQGARARLLSATHAELAAAVVADLSTAHHDLPDLVTRIDVYRWGHAMVRPRPGLLFGEALAKASEPLGRLRFSHTDLSGLPLFEEAQDSGVRAAEDVLRVRGAKFASLLS